MPIRYGRMLVSPFTFFRGAAYPMAVDLARAPRFAGSVTTQTVASIKPAPGPTVWRRLPESSLARIDGPLFFADADRFRTRVEELAREDGRPEKVVIDADAVHFTDTDGADILIQVAKELRSQGAALTLAQVHPPVLALWRRAGRVDVIGDAAIFDTVSAAVGQIPRQPEPPAAKLEAAR